ncbi:hypothetical protein KY290_010656 [Solanum tuberosum]|uniref:Uncharacterized protein n=1 Tax=Solanum tuberosum TaxID=4113 RepID=A0ABQ7W0J8_SOLTU|nr:hypothetical protein KY290_010656 [Solanum tuberosum]
MGFFFCHGSNSALHVYTDADWAGDQNDHTSTSTYVIYFGLAPISSSLKKQKIVAQSSTEAKYRVVAETNWLTNILKELRISLDNVPTIYYDNNRTTYLCQNPVFHSRMKHIVMTRAYTLEVSDTQEPLLVPKRTLILDDYKRKTNLSMQKLKN